MSIKNLLNTLKAAIVELFKISAIALVVSFILSKGIVAMTHSALGQEECTPSVEQSEANGIEPVSAITLF